jgi:hypothetical protein
MARESDETVYEIPDRWTAEHVMMRIIWAFDTLALCPGRAWPMGHKSGWPAYLYEFEDFTGLGIGDETPEQTAIRVAEERIEQWRPRPKAKEVSMMEEAFRWPVTYLSGEKIHIVRWAFERSRNMGEKRGIITSVRSEAERISNGLKKGRVRVR